MKRIKFMLLAALAAVFSLSIVSCDKEELELDPVIEELPLEYIHYDFVFDLGSLPEEYAKELYTVSFRRYDSEPGYSDVQTLIERCVALPMQEKVNEVAAKSGCYDFSVTINAYEDKDKSTLIYSKTVKPEEVAK